MKPLTYEEFAKKHSHTVYFLGINFCIEKKSHHLPACIGTEDECRGFIKMHPFASWKVEANDNEQLLNLYEIYKKINS